MQIFKVTITELFILILVIGCASSSHIHYQEIEPTNFVKIKLKSGETIQGSVLKAEPHQIILVHRGKVMKPIPKSSIHVIEQNPIISDDFSQGISEEEIDIIKTHKNTWAYGIGGGALSFGTSFFLGSLIANKTGENGGTVLGGTTIGCTSLGTFLFIRAGKKKDREMAIEAIKMKRREAYGQHKESVSQDQGNLQSQIKNERFQQEKLRKEREALLRELGTPKN